VSAHVRNFGTLISQGGNQITAPLEAIAFSTIEIDNGDLEFHGQSLDARQTKITFGPRDANQRPRLFISVGQGSMP
jgi:hypothetical protein